MIVHADPSLGRVTLEMSFSEATAPVSSTQFAEKMQRLLKPRWGDAASEKSKNGVILAWICIPSLTMQLKEAVENARSRAVA